MKNIILIIFTLIIGVAEAWGQSTPQTLAGGAIYAPTLESGQTSVTLNPLIISTTGGPVILDIPEGVTVNINGINGSGRTGAQPAICVPVGATLVITGGGILNVTGGNAGNGERGSLVFALFDDKYGDGGGGAAPGIGGTGGIGGRGNWNTGDIIYGEIGASMGKVYVIGNVVVNAQKGKAGESKVNTAVFGGGDGGKEPQYAIGGGGKGGDSKDGYKDATESPYYNLTSGNGTLYKNSTTTINYKNYQGNNDTPRSDVNTMPTTVAGHTFLGYRIGESWVFNTDGLIKSDLTVLDGYNGSIIEYWITTVTLDMQNGINGTGSITATYGSNMPTGSDIVAPTRTGYTFVGYFSEQNGNGIKYYDENMTSTHIWDIAHEGEIKLYAHWTINDYTLTYNVNGGNALSPDHKSVTYNTAYGELPTPTRTGYTFGGWYTQAIGGDAVSSETIMGAADVTIHAHWTANTYTVTLDKQNGSGGDDSVTATYDSAMPSATAPTRTGYTFHGYFTEANGEGTKYYNADMSSAHIWDKANNTTTLYAHWTANSYTVTLDANGGTGGTTSVSATYDSAMPSAEAPTRAGYTFGGYYSEASGGGTQYYDADMSSTHNWDINTNPSTLYAKWTVKQYTVNLDKQGGTGGTSSVTVNYDSAMPSATASTKTGYTFAGYYTEENGGGTKYYNADMSSAHNWDIDTNPSTLYAKWEANKCTINLDKQGGSGGTAYVTGTYDSAMPSATAPSRTGYTFAGYYTLPNGGGTQYYDENMVSVSYWNITTNPSTLYANWTANTYTLNFDVQNGDALSPSTQSVTYDAAYGTLPTPTRYGFAFKGWYTTPNGGSETDTEVLTSDIYSIDGDQTIYAHWNTIVVDIDAYSAETQLTGNYFRTFYDSQIAHILPTGVKAYKGKIEGNNLVLTAIEAKDDDDNDIIPKNVPVILRMMPNEEAGVPIPGDPYQIKTKQISLTTSESELTIDNTDNELIGSDIVIATAVANSYILSFGSNGLGFYEWSTHPLEAHKAYVIKDSANPAKALTFRFEDDVTGINETIKDFMFNDSNMAIYNLNGIRLSKPQKGLNIINGRKVWVK